MLLHVWFSETACHWAQFICKSHDSKAAILTLAIYIRLFMLLVWRASPFTREEGSGVVPIRDLF